MAVLAINFFSSALRSIKGSFRTSYAFKPPMAILSDFPLSSFCNTEKSVPSVAGTTTSPSTIAEEALIRNASFAIFLNRLVQSLPRRVKTLTFSLAMRSWTR
jgi:hypothetical protein